MGILERNGKRTVPAHGMTKDSGSQWVDLKGRGDSLRQFFGDVRIHSITVRPRCFGGIDIETCADAKVVALRVARDVKAAGTRVRNDYRQPELRCDALGAGFDDEVLLGTSQPRQPIEHGYPTDRSLGWPEDPEAHGTARFGRIVRIGSLHAAKALVLGKGLDAHVRDRAAPVSAVPVETEICGGSGALIVR